MALSATLSRPRPLGFAHPDGTTSFSQKPLGANPDLLVFGSKFLKGDQYLILDPDVPLPPKKVKPRVRYFSEPEEIQGFEKDPEGSVNPVEFGAELNEPQTSELQGIICIQCGRPGHIVCGNGLQKMQIKWKPAIEFMEMKKRVRIAELEENKEEDDMEMNIAYHLKSIAGNTKVKANSTFSIDKKYKKYKNRLKKSKKIYCCRCGDHHKLSECPIKLGVTRWQKGTHTFFGNNPQPGSDSDGSTASNEASIEEFLVNALIKNKKVPAKFKKTINRGLFKRCAKIAKMRKTKKCIKKVK